MATLKEIRKELVALRDTLIGRIGGLSSQKRNEDEEWYKYAITTSKKTLNEINKIIEMLDDVRG